MTDLIYQKWMIVVACILNVTDLTYILYLTFQGRFYDYTIADHDYVNLMQAVWFELNGTEILRFTLHRSHYKFSTRTYVKHGTVSCYRGYDDQCEKG